MSSKITGCKYSRRQFIKAAGMAAGSLALAACGAPASPSTEEEPTAVVQPKEEEPTAVVQPKEPVEVGFMHFTAPLWEPGIKGFIATFEENNPDIKIDWQPFPYGQYWEVLTTSLASGDVPDIILLEHVNIDKYVHQGALQPLDAFFESDNWDLSVFHPSSNYHMTAQGKHYGVGWSTEGSNVFYNKDLFDELGVEYPPADGDWDWNDFLDLAKRVTRRRADGTVEYLGAMVSYYFPINDALGDVIFSNGGRFLNDDSGYDKCLLGEEPAREAIKFLASLTTEHGVAPTPEEQEAFQGGFVTGRYAMRWAQSGRFHNFLDAEFETDITSVPYSPTTGCRLSGSSSNFYGMAKDAKHPEEAWEFMKWLGNGDSPDSPQAIFAYETDLMVPHMEANEKYWLGKNLEKDRQSAFESLNHHFRYPHCPPLWDAALEAHNGVVEILTGAPADETIDRLVERVDKILQDNPTPEGWGTIWEEHPDCRD